MYRRLIRSGIALLSGMLLCGCLISSIWLTPAPESARTRRLAADVDTTWTAVIEVLVQRDLQIAAMKKERGWISTDFAYFPPMEFGEPVLEGKLMLGSYLDVRGGRYRVTIHVKPDGAETAVTIDTTLERLEERPSPSTAPEPSFTLDLPAARRGYLVPVSQPSNGVIERQLFQELEQTLAAQRVGRNTAPP